MFSGTLLVVLGFLLVGTLAYAIFFYYSPSRKNEVEEAKYTMLEDDDEVK